MSRSTLFVLSWRPGWLLAALLTIGLAVGCGSSPPLAHDADEDLFLSYVQATQSLASGLSQFRTNSEFEKSKQYPDKQVEDLSAHREELLSLPVEDRRRLAEKHIDLIEQTTAACKRLEQRHSKNSEIIGEHWDRYWEALQFRQVIEPE